MRRRQHPVFKHIQWTLRGPSTRCFKFAMVAATVIGVGETWAIPTQMLNPHSDDATDISWKNGTAAPESTNHLHLNLRTGEAIEQRENSIRSNMGWEADSVWDNRQLRFKDTPVADDGRNTLGASFGHGYINPSEPAHYRFDDSVPDDARDLLKETFRAWDEAAKIATSGKTTQAGHAVRTDIAFVNNQTDYDLTFHFVEGFQEGANSFAEWVVSREQINPLGNPVYPPGERKMVYEATPVNQIWIDDADWEFSIDNGLSWRTQFDQQVNWSFDKTPALLAALDIDYRRISTGDVFEGNEAAFQALNIPVRTNTRTQETNTFKDTLGMHVSAPDTIDLYEMDFFTIALHETGHVIGLLHDPTSAAGSAGNIMAAHIARDASFGNVIHDIDPNSGYGAALLYSIPMMRDYGDAPDSYKTLQASNGPRYSEGRYYLTGEDVMERRRVLLGRSWDMETDGQPTLFANGDDHSIRGVAADHEGRSARLDDEDGVVFGPDWVDVFFTLDAHHNDMFSIRAWWDTNRDGTFGHPNTEVGTGPSGEMYIDELFSLLDSEVMFVEGATYKIRKELGFNPLDYYSRFRLTWMHDSEGWWELNKNNDVLGLTLDIKPFGEFARKELDAIYRSYGEVEDYPPIPEPATASLAMLSLGGLMLRRRRMA